MQADEGLTELVPRPPPVRPPSIVEYLHPLRTPEDPLDELSDSLEPPALSVALILPARPFRELDGLPCGLDGLGPGASGGSRVPRCDDCRDRRRQPPDPLPLRTDCRGSIWAASEPFEPGKRDT